MNIPAPKALAIYARKSTESEDRQVLSIDSQVKELKSFAEHEGLKVGRVFIESKSAKSPGRPVFNELFSLVRKRKFDSVMCWKLDRIARNPVDGGAVIWAMEERQLQAIYTPQRVFLNTGNDKFWMQLEFGMAKKYVDDLSDNTRRGLKTKIELGWRPGLAPLGYLNDRETKTIVKDPERFPLIRRMWDLMLTGNYSAKAVLDIASDNWGLRTRALKRIGGGKVSFSGVYDLFTNPFYCGVIRYKNGLYKGAHEAMVTSAEYDRVQSILSSRKKRRPRKHAFKYTGLIKCGECGASITAEHRRNRYGCWYLYYHCTKKKRNVQCSQGVISEEKLEEQIVSFLRTLSVPNRIADWAIGVLAESRDEARANEEVLRKSSENRIAACTRELSVLIDMRLRNVISDTEFVNKKVILEKERLVLEESLTKAHDKATDSVQASICAINFARLAVSGFIDGTDEDKRAILSYTGSNLTLEHRILRIQAQKPLELIRNSLCRWDTPGGRFEPGIRGELKPKNPREDAGFRALLRTVKSIRTFFRDHPEEIEKIKALRIPSVINWNGSAREEKMCQRP